MAYVPNSGSVVTFQSDPTKLVGSVSIVSTVPSSVLVLNPVSVLSVTQGTTPWAITQNSPSIIAYQLAGSVMQVTGTQYTENNASTPSVVGNAILYKKDETNSVLSAVSPQHPLPVQGSITTLQGTNPWIVNVPTPSYVTFQAAGSVLNANISGSVAAAVINFTASVAANLQSTNASLITIPRGSFGGNNAWAQTDSLIAVGGVRNDTLSSVAAADGRYTPITVGPVGENIVANAPITKWVQGIGSVFGGTSIQVIAPQGTSVFTYITGVQIANASANNVYLTFTGGLGGITSVLGYTVAPANGGSNIFLPNAWKTGANSGFSASVSGVASIYLSAEGFISKT